MRAWAWAALAAVLLAGCGGSVPNNGDDHVEVMLSSRLPVPRWYEVVAVAADGREALRANVTAGLGTGSVELGDLGFGTYAITARTAGEAVSAEVRLGQRSIVYVTHDEGYPLQVVASSLGE